MFLSELANLSAVDKKQFQDGTAAMKTDTRKTRLTLEQINKMRKLNDLKMSEYADNVKEIRRQYAPASE